VEDLVEEVVAFGGRELSVLRPRDAEATGASAAPRPAVPERSTRVGDGSGSHSTTALTALSGTGGPMDVGRVLRTGGRIMSSDTQRATSDGRASSTAASMARAMLRASPKRCSGSGASALSTMASSAAGRPGTSLLGASGRKSLGRAKASRSEV
jgi:hypothetical protein